MLEACIYSIQNTVKLWNILQFKNRFYLKIFTNVIYSCDGSCIFRSHFLKFSVSHDPSEISLICRFGAQETFLSLSALKTVVLVNIFVHVFLPSDLNRKLPNNSILYQLSIKSVLLLILIHFIESVLNNVYGYFNGSAYQNQFLQLFINDTLHFRKKVKLKMILHR